ncbi:MAG TPA: hypothetical protein PLL77_09790 [Pyrinomonadaceae bacterium]|nr:hypothetical protein [Pyrinomonadaceae bacterium]
MSDSRLFTWRQMLIYTSVFVGSVFIAQRVLRYVSENLLTIDNPYYWPVSIFGPRFPSLRDLAVAAAVTAAFFLFCRVLEVKRFNILLSIVFGVILIAGLNFIHGLDVGYYAPIAGDARTGPLIPYTLDGQEYFHDALSITDPVDFFRRYNEIQPTLHMHGHTHPPGAVLTFYVLTKLFRDPAIIAFVIMILATIPTIFFSYRVLRTELSEETARYMAFLLVLLPAVQIYYLASLDALIVALLTGVLYLFCFRKGYKSAAGAIVLLTASFLLTFVSLFILPVLVGFDLIVKRSIKRSLIVVGGMVGVHVLFYLLMGYDAWHSFRNASLHENPNGFMLFVDPVNYLFTRVEDVSEILFFFGPFLLVLMIRGFRTKFQLRPLAELRQRPLLVLTVLACTSLLGMYAVGAWRTGETARACAHIYPYLLFPVGYYLEDGEVGSSGRLQLAALVFLQSVGMQIFGTYHW